MKIALVSPDPPESPHGNGVTARRWAGLLGELGHTVRVSTEYDGDRYDLLVALHARKSADAVRAFHAAQPSAPIVVALTGTDLYPDLASTGVDRDLLRLAPRLVVLQERGLAQLPRDVRGRARVIVQSLPPVPRQPARSDCFEVAFLAHVRPVKDPLRLAAAVRQLPASSRIQVTHLGEGRDADLAGRLASESAASSRYTWLGPSSHGEALQVLARSQALALTSKHEGGANVVSEAIAAGIPVISSRIDGSVGLLGEDYPGYFPPGDTGALATLLDTVERNADGLHHRLRERCASLTAEIDPAREREAWRGLLAELAAATPA